MNRVLLLQFLLLPVAANASISGPTTSTTGTFTLSWSSSAHKLQEVSSTGTWLQNYYGTSATIAKPAGTYYYEEIWCFWLPYSGQTCYANDAHQVTVSSSGPSYPESVTDQGDYSYQIHSGDFDGNGRTDLYVERLTAGPPDGSMQSYVVWNNTDGTISTDKLTSNYAAAAQNAPLDTTLNLMVGDANADGYADHFIERIDEVMGSQFEQEVVVFAPGTASNKERPQGFAEMTDDVKSFVDDIARWSNDEDYFANNINTVLIPVFSVGFSFCRNSSPWSEFVYSYRGRSCIPYLFQSGWRTVQYGVNFDALAVSGYLDALHGTDGPTDNDLWQISQVFFGVFGVHAFGFDTSGTRHTTNFVADDEEEERILATIEWYSFVIRTFPLDDPSRPAVPGWHNYPVDNNICSTSQSWCTLENIACWGRHYHALGKVGEEGEDPYAEPVENGEVVPLDLGPTVDPIRVGVGEAAGLPEHAVAQITQPDHIFHNHDMGQWETCPQTVPDQGRGTPPQICNQVYREPYVGTDGDIHMSTRGSGWHYWPVTNQVLGPLIFEALDEDMIEAIQNDPDHLCPSL